jgi:hypothetical protein
MEKKEKHGHVSFLPIKIKIIVIYIRCPNKKRTLLKNYTPSIGCVLQHTQKHTLINSESGHWNITIEIKP